MSSLPAGLKSLDDVLKYSYFKSQRYSSKLNSLYPRKNLPIQIVMKKIVSCVFSPKMFLIKEFRFMQDGQLSNLGLRFPQIFQFLKSRTTSELQQFKTSKINTGEVPEPYRNSESFIMCSSGERISLQDVLAIRATHCIKVTQKYNCAWLWIGLPSEKWMKNELWMNY